MSDALITDNLTDEILLSKSQDLLVQTQADLTAMLDVMDVPGTLREQERYEHTRAVLRAREQTLTQHMPTLRMLQPQIAELTAVRDVLIPIRAQLSAELLAMEPNDVRQYNWRWSLQKLESGAASGAGFAVENTRLGQLLIAAGWTAGPSFEGRIPPLPWRGSLMEIEDRLAALQASYDDARTRLLRLVQEGATKD
jgi:hypothetical protein